MAERVDFSVNRPRVSDTKTGNTVRPEKNSAVQSPVTNGNIGNVFEGNNSNQNNNLNIKPKEKPLTKEQKQEIAKKFREELAKIKEKQSWIGKSWNWFKNKTTIGLGSDKVDKLISKFENGDISAKDVQEKLKEFNDGQNMCVDVFADIVSGVAAVGIYTVAVAAAPFSGGASIAVGVAAAAASSAAIKTGIKFADAKAAGKEYSWKDAGIDAATGSVNGLLAPITGGVGGAVGKTVATKIGVTAVQESAKMAVKETAMVGAKTGFRAAITRGLFNPTGYKYVGGTALKRGFAFGAECATDGALGGSLDNMLRASISGENVLEAGVSGFAGGLVMAPVIGGGFKLAGKGANKILGKNADNIGTEISEQVAKNTDTASDVVAKNGDNVEITHPKPTERKITLNLARNPKFECDIPYQEGNFYRMIGDGGYQDFLETGLIRAKQDSKFGYNDIYFEKGHANAIYAKKGGANYIVETNSPKIEIKDGSYPKTQQLDKNDTFRIWQRQEDGSYKIVYDTINDDISKQTKKIAPAKLAETKVELNTKQTNNLIIPEVTRNIDEIILNEHKYVLKNLSNDYNFHLVVERIKKIDIDDPKRLEKIRDEFLNYMGYPKGSVDIRYENLDDYVKGEFSWDTNSIRISEDFRQEDNLYVAGTIFHELIHFDNTMNIIKKIGIDEFLSLKFESALPKIKTNPAEVLSEYPNFPINGTTKEMARFLLDSTSEIQSFSELSKYAKIENGDFIDNLIDELKDGKYSSHYDETNLVDYAQKAYYYYHSPDELLAYSRQDQFFDYVGKKHLIHDNEDALATEQARKLIQKIAREKMGIEINIDNLSKEEIDELTKIINADISEYKQKAEKIYNSGEIWEFQDKYFADFGYLPLSFSISTYISYQYKKDTNMLSLDWEKLLQNQ